MARLDGLKRQQTALRERIRLLREIEGLEGLLATPQKPVNKAVTKFLLQSAVERLALVDRRIADLSEGVHNG